MFERNLPHTGNDGKTQVRVRFFPKIPIFLFSKESSPKFFFARSASALLSDTLPNLFFNLYVTETLPNRKKKWPLSTFTENGFFFWTQAAPCVKYVSAGITRSRNP